MEILFVADPLESFKIYKDTTFAMMREAQRREEIEHVVFVTALEQTIRARIRRAVTPPNFF